MNYQKKISNDRKKMALHISVLVLLTISVLMLISNKVYAALPSQTITVSNIKKPIGTKAFKVKVIVNNGNKTGKVQYTIKDTSIASINNKGYLKVRKIGVTKLVVTVAGNNKYAKTSKTVIITVVPSAPQISSLGSSIDGELTVKWGKINNISGYQLRYSTDEAFSAYKSISIGSSKKSYTIKDLIPQRNYYVKIKSYKKVGNNTLYSAWSTTKKIKIKGEDTGLSDTNFDSPLSEGDDDSISGSAVGGIIKNGYYRIQSANHSNRYLDIENSGLNNGDNLIINSSNSNLSQIFYVQHVGNGFYSFRAVHSGNYLHKAGNSDNVHQWQGWQNDNALWKIENASSGWYAFKNKSNGKYLDNTSGNTVIGNNVRTYALNKSYSQQWKLISTSKPAFIVTWNDCVVPSGSYLNPSAFTVKGKISSAYPMSYFHVAIYDMSGKPRCSALYKVKKKSFSFSIGMDVSTLPAGKYFCGVKLMNGLGELYRIPKNDFTILRPSAISNGTYIIRTGVNENMSLDVAGARKNDRTNIQIYQYKGGANQKFRIDRLSSGWYMITDTNSGKVLDVSGGRKASGVNVQLYSWNGSDAQLWRFYPIGNGYYYIQNKLGYYLNVNGANNRNGANVQVYNADYTKAEQWKLTYN